LSATVAAGVELLIVDEAARLTTTALKKLRTRVWRGKG